jgi:hypothetical protein
VAPSPPLLDDAEDGHEVRDVHAGGVHLQDIQEGRGAQTIPRLPGGHVTEAEDVSDRGPTPA